MENKRCTKCGEVKGLSEFYKNKDSKDGFRSNCKGCVKIHNAKWQKENPEKVKKNNAKWQKENPGKNRAYSAKYRKENPEKDRKRNIRTYLKKQIGETPPPELVEIKLLIYKTKKLCKTLKN